MTEIEQRKNETPTCNEKPKTNKKIRNINIILTVIIVLLVALLVVFQFVITPMTVKGESMEKTFHTEDKIFVQKKGYKLNYGDIIVFKRPGSNEPPIKRIIGMSGDNIKFDVRRNVWIRNDEILQEKYTNEDLYLPNYFFQADEMKEILTGKGLDVGEGELFVLGDNRNYSYDSHMYGCIKKDWIVGKFVGRF